MRRPLVALVSAGLGASMLWTAPAWAQWAVAGHGDVAGAAATMPTGATPSASARGFSVALRWPAAQFADGTPVGGYVITRYDAINGSAAVVGEGCAGVVTTTTCTELSVSSGTWVYAVTPVQANWVGSPSPPSQPVTVP